MICLHVQTPSYLFVATNILATCTTPLSRAQAKPALDGASDSDDKAHAGSDVEENSDLSFLDVGASLLSRISPRISKPYPPFFIFMIVMLSLNILFF